MAYGLNELVKEIDLCNRMISSQQAIIDLAHEWYQIASPENRDQFEQIIQACRGIQKNFIRSRNQSQMVLEKLHQAVGPLR